MFSATRVAAGVAILALAGSLAFVASGAVADWLVTREGDKVEIDGLRPGSTYRYEIGSDGTLSEKALFAEHGSDGMTIDNEGNVYLTGKGVTVFDRTGNRPRRVKRVREWDNPVCRQPTFGHFQACQTAEGGRYAHRSARVSADGAECHVRGERCSGASG